MRAQVNVEKGILENSAGFISTIVDLGAVQPILVVVELLVQVLEYALLNIHLAQDGVKCLKYQKNCIYRKKLNL